MVEISQNFVAFSEYMNCIYLINIIMLLLKLFPFIVWYLDKSRKHKVIDNLLLSLPMNQVFGENALLGLTSNNLSKYIL